MATEELGNLEIVEETPPTTPTEQEPKKKRPCPHNPDQATEFVIQTAQSVGRFMSKMQHESDTIEEGYQVLVAEYHHSLCGIKDYFKWADRKLVLELLDDTTYKLLRTTTPKDATDKEKCPDPRVSTENLMTGHRALNRLAALPNFKDIESADREEVCQLFDSLQTAHATIADAAGSFASLGCRLHPHQFQFLLKHSIHPLIQLQIPAYLCHPGELRFEKQYLSNDELYEQHCVNTLLPRSYHPALDSIPPKHPTRALAAAIHYHLWKRMCTKFNASQTEVANLFQVKIKTFFTSITGCEYDPGKKPTKSEKLKPSPKKDRSPRPSESTTSEVDPKMPPLEDIRPKKKLRFKDPI